MFNVIATQNRSQRLLARLRAETRPQHDNLEHNPLLKRLLSKETTQMEYADILRRYYTLMRIYENQVKSSDFWQAIRNRFEISTKTELLRQDLLHCGIAESHHIYPGMEKLRFATENPAQILGTAYVHEGSSLGGRYISKHLRAHPGLTTGAGASYFAGYGEDTVNFWKSFCEFINSFSGSSEMEDQVVAAAKHAFKTFDQAMSLK